MFFSCSMLHIDEHAFYPNETEETHIENLEKMKQLSEKIQVPLTILKIEDELGFDPEKCIELMEANDTKGSCKEDTLVMLRNRVIYKYAKNNGFKKIMVGDNGLRVSTQIQNFAKFNPLCRQLQMLSTPSSREEEKPLLRTHPLAPISCMIKI